MYNDEDIFSYLTELSKSGVENIAAIKSYLKTKFKMDNRTAGQFIGDWKVMQQKPQCLDCE